MVRRIHLGAKLSLVDFWHSDKAQYQSELAQKIAKLFTQIGEVHGVDKQKAWFEAFLYISNLHWDKVDNYRIDKYLMFLRYQLNEVLQFLKVHEYDDEKVSTMHLYLITFLIGYVLV